MGQDGEDGARHARRDAALAAIDESVRAVDPIWVERFRTDVAADTAAEQSILIKGWTLGVLVFFLILLHRLFS